MTHMEPIVSDFAASGRSGRRNALPDILSSSGKHPAELPLKFSDLSVGGSDTAERSLEESSLATASPVGDQVAGVELPDE
uniref:cAMP-dependent protein kinase inhibitor alpha-like n=1 Tax=Myxine glutinosa TaxID=7769 RepID=UPI00358F5C1E